MPKTGGSWATAAMFAGGVAAWRPDSMSFHADLEESREYADRFTFAFVRHPLEFWRSYWAYRMRNGWDAEHYIDRRVASPNFDEFVNRVIECFPGEAGATFERFIGPIGNEIDFVGRQERLADDLVAALRLAGEDFDERALRACPHVNVSEYAQTPAVYTRRTSERLAESERAAIDRFYPWEPVPARLLGEPDGSPIDARLRRLQQAELELRDARAELAVRRRAAARDHSLLANQEARLAEAHDALASLRASRLLRYTRPLRLRWYRIRARPHHNAAHGNATSTGQPITKPRLR